MEANPRGLVVLALYQLSLAVGIVLLPVAMMTRKLGVPLPFHRVICRLEKAYERSSTR